jgi:hypothetical protein
MKQQYPHVLLHPPHDLIFVIGQHCPIFVHDVETFSLARTDQESQAGYAVLKANVPGQVEGEPVVPDRSFRENTEQMSPRKVRPVGHHFNQHKRRGRYQHSTKELVPRQEKKKKKEKLNKYHEPVIKCMQPASRLKV